ncbi:MAG TPA: hypothetical protein VLG11_03045 [Candidatus Saccharimonadales bacterium]|nr:hypothetical protein [Candidatus Saccharimonadales bacterium]
MVSPENASFAATLAEHRQQTEVPSEIIVRALGTPALTSSRVAVRLRGGYVTECAVASQRTGKVVSLFETQEEQLTMPEPAASHTTCAVEGLDADDEEGFARWVDYRPVTNGKTAHVPIIALQADVGDGPFGLRKIVGLQDSGLTTTSILCNRTAEPQKAALGEHYCFDLHGNSLQGVAINGLRMGRHRSGRALQARLEDGAPSFFAGYQGSALLDFPDGRHVVLSAVASTGVQNKNGRIQIPDSRIGMMLWHQPDSSKFCLEPTLRHYDTEHRRMATGSVVLPPDHVVALTTIINAK